MEAWWAGGTAGSWMWASEEAEVVGTDANDVLQRPEVFPRTHLLPNGRVFLACSIDGKTYASDAYLSPTIYDRRR